MIRLAALFVCTVLGAGFATGQEIMRYFSDYGIVGLLGVIVSSAVFGLCLYKTKYYNNFGEILADMPFCAEVVIFLSFIIFYSAMISAMGEIVWELFGVNKILTGVLMALLVCTLTIMGAENIIAFGEIICLPMIVITVIVGIKLMLMPIEFRPPASSVKGVFSPFIYVSYNLASSLAVVTEHKYKKGMATFSAILIGITALAIAIPLYKYYGFVKNCPLPVLNLLPQGELLTYLYIFTIGGAVFTTAVSNSYSASQYLKNKTGKNKAVVCVTVALLSLLLSFIGFENIVARGYFVFGLTGLLLMFKVLLKKKTN